MSDTTTTSSGRTERRPSGNQLVLAEFMGAPDRTLNNVQLGGIYGVQAFRSRIADLRRLGYVIPRGVKVAHGRYAYALLGTQPGSQAAKDKPSLPVLSHQQQLDAESDALARIEREREKIAKRGEPKRAPQSLLDQLATERDAVHRLTAESDVVRAKLSGVLREQPDEAETLEDLADRVVEAFEHARRPRARRVSNGSRGPTGPELMRKVIEESGRPLHSKVIARRVMEGGGDAVYHGKTPDATMAAQLATSNKNGGEFVKVAPGCFGLREWPAAKLEAEPVRDLEPEPEAVTT